jgi:DNA-binding SARP family transcriptional activator/TolB-like protein/Tfp pilus assembly protein PilF
MIDPPKPPLLSIALLGSFQLQADGKPLASFPRKAKALLAYLAMQEEQRVSREALADLLWSDRGAEQARHSLRQMLLVLRRGLGTAGLDAIDASEHAISFQPDAVEADVARMHRLAAAPDRASLAEAADLYTGPFLADFPSVCPDFDTWLGRTRDRIASFVLDILSRLADRCGAEGDAAGAVLAVERMVALDPLREDIHRRLMMAYGAAGRRTDAIRQYNACVEMLRRDLDVSPEAETVALFQRIRDGDRISTDRPPEASALAVFPRVSEGTPWIAVLPFRTLGADPVPDYFADGLVDDIVCALAMLREPVVISAGSTRAYRTQPVDLRQVGHELGARYVAAGSIRKAGTSLRIAVELAEADSGAILWAQPYDVEIVNLFDAQDSIVSRIVSTWLPRLHEAEMRRVHAKRPENMTAYDLVLQARDFIFRLNRESLEIASSLLSRAILLDPHYAMAYAVMADLLNLRIGQGWSHHVMSDAQAVDRLARTAIESDPYNARALAIQGHNRSYMFRDYDAALILFDRTTEAAPNDATGWMWSACTYAYIGDGKGAVARAQRALRLSPRDTFLFRFHTSLCLAHYTNGTYEEAIYWGRLGIQDAPQYTANLRFTAAALVEIGGLDEARDLIRQAVSVQPEYGGREIIQRQAYREPERRRKFAQQLIAAGLPE